MEAPSRPRRCLNERTCHLTGMTYGALAKLSVTDLSAIVANLQLSTRDGLLVKERRRLALKRIDTKKRDKAKLQEETVMKTEWRQLQTTVPELQQQLLDANTTIAALKDEVQALRSQLAAALQNALRV